MDVTFPIGPGFFIFFQDPVSTADIGPSDDGPDRRYQEDKDLFVLIHAFLTIENNQ